MTIKNYWTSRYNNLPNYIVVGSDMDGITGYQVIHKDNEREWRSGCYSSEITHGISMNKQVMKDLADKMNREVV